MVTAEISVIPMDTCATSSSDIIAEAERVFSRHPDVKNSITAMGTELESNDINKLFDVLKEMRQASFNHSAKRIYTIIKIDDRRDKESTLEQKVKSVSEKIRH
ncbi:MAG TPA: MTH1187 family thiamine-binding protein [Candidatus Gastranaerophilales bacterium]|nr:MTH1187 family thiamine-binding protein [Candidatus Gastranaerophilales bacterium]